MPVMNGGSSPEKYHPPFNDYIAKERRWSSSHATPQATPKEFLVFDQSGGQTMVFRCDVSAPFNAIHVALNEQSRTLFKETKLADFNPAEIKAEESEMREDTEELNALLYSSSDGRFEEDEVDSTGHSPGNVEEEGSSDGGWLKRKGEWEDGAESKRVGEFKKIRDTVSVLQKILPEGASDDPLMVIDEAIEYLKCLKHKAERLESPAVSLCP